MGGDTQGEANEKIESRGFDAARGLMLSVQQTTKSAVTRRRGTRRDGGIARILGLLALTTLAACGGGGGGDGGRGGSAGFAPVATDPAPAEAEPVAKERVEAPTMAGECSVSLYGDSIMVGVAPAFAQARGKYRIEHKAVPGTQLMSLDRIFDNDIRTARFVVIENGNIDAWQGIPPALLSSTLGAMVDHVRAEGRVAVLTGPSHVAQFPGSLLTTFGDAGRALFEAEVKKLAADRH